MSLAPENGHLFALSQPARNQGPFKKETVVTLWNGNKCVTLVRPHILFFVLWRGPVVEKQVTYGSPDTSTQKCEGEDGMRLFFLSGKQKRCKQVYHVEWWSQLHHLPLVPTCHVTSFQHASGTSRQGRAGGTVRSWPPSARGEVRAVLGNRYGSNVGRNASLEKTV